MELRAPRKLSSPKDGNRYDECEDACLVVYPFIPDGVRSEAARMAVCDGASEAAFARQWAQILAEGFVRHPLALSTIDAGSLSDWLVPLQAQWQAIVPWDRLPWHGEAKARAGSLATLLGVTVVRKTGSRRELEWETTAVGDSCFFLVRNDELHFSFPLEEPAQFNNTPFLICSQPVYNDYLLDSIRVARGDCQPGDILLLTSDALALWFLRERVAEKKPWRTLLELDSTSWEVWLSDLRAARQIRNDDTTLIIVEVV